MLFAACFGAYVGNGDFLPGNDQVGNMLFSLNLLKRHSFAISPPDAPQAFFWTIEKPGQEPVPTAIDEWTESTDAAYREGRLTAPSHFYYASPTVFPEVYVITFGVGAPLAGAPVYAVLDLFVDIEHDRFWWWHGAALTASLLTALAALFVFLAARGFVEPVPAVLIVLAFGLGSCAWPVSSEITKRDIPGSGGAAARLRVPGCVPLVGSTDLGVDAARVDRPVEIDTGGVGRDLVPRIASEGDSETAIEHDAIAGWRLSPGRSRTPDFRLCELRQRTAGIVAVHVLTSQPILSSKRCIASAIGANSLCGAHDPAAPAAEPLAA